MISQAGKMALVGKEDEIFTADNSILDAQSIEHYRRAVTKGLEQVIQKISSVEKPFSGIQPRELAERFTAVDINQPVASLEQALAEVEALYLDDAVYFHHPRYVAHLNCPIAIPAIVAELILSSVNSSLDTWDQSAGGTLIEHKLVDWTASRIGLGADADGVFTSGGTQSNLMALLLARDSFCYRRRGFHVNRRHGLPAEAHKLRVMVSAAGHFSIQKAAAILGLGYDSVIPVPCDGDQRMDPHELEWAIKDCLTHGLMPMAVVATAGTTDFGSIDPLSVVANICQHYGLWLHVDAAYGCGLLLSERRRHWLAGIERADSVTVDYHKSFLQPVSCSAFLVRDRRHLAFVTYHADYLNPASQQKEDIPNQVDKSIQTTRRFDALKLWLTLRTMGVAALGEAFDAVVDRAGQGYELLRAEAEIEAPWPPRLSTLVFRYRPRAGLDQATLDTINAGIRKALLRSGETVIAATRVEGRQYLKFTLLNPRTTVQDLEHIIGLIVREGRRLCAGPRSDAGMEVCDE